MDRHQPRSLRPADRLRAPQCTVHVRCGATGRDADHEIVAGNSDCIEIARAALGTVFGAFLSAEECRRATSDEADHEPKIGTESGRNFAGIEHAEPPGTTCSRINDPAAGTQRMLGGGDGMGERIALRRDRRRNACVLGRDDVHDLQR